jgi:hypothetical protein
MKNTVTINRGKFLERSVMKDWLSQTARSLEKSS